MVARTDAGAPRKRRQLVFIDQELRARVDGDIAAFLAAFDAALADDTPAKAGRHCAKPPTGCCGPAPAPGSSSNGSKRAMPLPPRDSTAACDAGLAVIAEPVLPSPIKKRAPFTGALFKALPGGC